VNSADGALGPSTRRWTIRRSRFTEEQIIGVLMGHEAGMKAQDLWRKHGISDATLLNGKARYGGMTTSDVAKRRSL
jgi:putative transposase